MCIAVIVGLAPVNSTPLQVLQAVSNLRKTLVKGGMVAEVALISRNFTH